MKVYVARYGQIIGAYSPNQLKDAIASGTVLTSDYGWNEGMVEWRPIGMMLAVDELANDPKSSENAAQSPATGKQIAYIRGFGVTPPEGLTRTQATKLIDVLREDPAKLKVLKENQKHVAPTRKQLKFIRELGGDSAEISSMAQARETIDNLIERKVEWAQQVAREKQREEAAFASAYPSRWFLNRVNLAQRRRADALHEAQTEVDPENRASG